MNAGDLGSREVCRRADRGGLAVLLMEEELKRREELERREPACGSYEMPTARQAHQEVGDSLLLERELEQLERMRGGYASSIRVQRMHTRIAVERLKRAVDER